VAAAAEACAGVAGQVANISGGICRRGARIVDRAALLVQ